jgi:hypothetical protein
MIQNEFKKIVPEKKPKKERKERKQRKSESRVGKAIRSVLDGSILTRDLAIRLLPFVLFLALICVVYIANSYYAEKTIIKTDKIRRQLKDLEDKFISSKSELMMCSKRSEVAAMIDSIGVIESLQPPKKIFVQQENNQKTPEKGNE